jgi:hypothetical protein
MIFDYPTLEESLFGYLYLILAAVPISIAAYIISRFPLPLFLPGDDIAIEEERLRRHRIHTWVLRLTLPPSMILLSIGFLYFLGDIIGGFFAVFFILISFGVFLPNDMTNPIEKLESILAELPQEEDIIRKQIENYFNERAISYDKRIRILNYLLDRDDVIGVVAAEMSTELEIDMLHR